MGVSALGSRLRRLFESLNGPVTDLYRREFRFEQRWFGLTLLLSDEGPLSVRDAAQFLGASHVSVLQIAKAMETKGLLIKTKDTDDGRVSRLSLTDAGKDAADAIGPISARVDRAALALLAEAAPDFIANLTRLENALRETPFSARLDDASESKTEIKEKAPC